MNARHLFSGLCLSVICLPATLPAVELANRVFVSARSGNDANSCGNILTPCQTFAGAVLQLNPGGDAVVLDTGGYGPVTITQGVTIEAAPGVTAFIHPPSGSAITVNASGETVVLRGLTIEGAGAIGNGINVTSVGYLHVESCVITGFAGSYPNGIGIYFTSAGQLFVKDTISRGNDAGIWVIPASGNAQASVDHCRLEANFYGLLSDSNSKVTIRDSVASGNAVDGLVSEGSGELNAEGCLVANNGNIGLACYLPATLRASNCTVTDNSTGLVASGSLLTRLNNTVEGNGTEGSFSGTYSAK